MRRGERPWRVAGVVEAPPERVWEVLLESSTILPDDEKAAIKRGPESVRYQTVLGRAGEGRTYVEVNRLERSIAVQGEWWYRGVTSVRPDRRGSLLCYDVYNIAPGVGWWAAQLVQGPQHARQMQRVLREQLDTIGQHLGCASYLVG
jgi:hypothetical protein